MIKDVCYGCMEEISKEPCEYCGWSSQSDDNSSLHLQPGTILQGKYLIGKVLGQGGFGITYLAKDIMLDIKLAVKEYLPQDLASRTMGQSKVSMFSNDAKEHFLYGMERFLMEAKTLAKFEQHPSIVSVRDFFEANGTAYIVMTYIQGITLKEYVQSKGNKLEVDQAVQIILPVLDALKTVHSAGILHRDISTDNIFITNTGQVILIDFGAARQSVSDKGRSMSILLKPGYTPEEQYRSKGKQGPWTDIYAVGVTMYRIITGEMPSESLDRLTDDDLIPPSQKGIAIEPYVEESLMKALAVIGSERFQTAEEFQSALLSGMGTDVEMSNTGNDTNIVQSNKRLHKESVIPTAYVKSIESEPFSFFKKNRLIGGASVFLVFALLIAFTLKTPASSSINENTTSDASNGFEESALYTESETEKSIIPEVAQDDATGYELSDDITSDEEDEVEENNVDEEVIISEPSDMIPKFNSETDLNYINHLFGDNGREKILNAYGMPIDEVAFTEEYLELDHLELHYADMVFHLHYNSFDQDSFRLNTVDVTGPNFVGPRNIRIGDMSEDVLSKFPDENHPITVDISSNYHYAKKLYGDDEWISEAGVYYNEKKQPAAIMFYGYDGGGGFEIYFENCRVVSFNFGFHIF